MHVLRLFVALSSVFALQTRSRTPIYPCVHTLVHTLFTINFPYALLHALAALSTIPLTSPQFPGALPKATVQIQTAIQIP